MAIPQWVPNILLPLVIAFAVPTVNTIADSGRQEQRMMQVEKNVDRIVDTMDSRSAQWTDLIERTARTEAKVDMLIKGD